MATTDNQRLKLMYLLDILRERTDEEHTELKNKRIRNRYICSYNEGITVLNIA